MENGLPDALAKVQAAHERAASVRKDQRQITIKIDADTLQAAKAGSLLLVSFVCASGWTSRIFSPAQLERALPQLQELDFPLLVSEYHPNDAHGTQKTSPKPSCCSPVLALN